MGTCRTPLPAAPTSPLQQTFAFCAFYSHPAKLACFLPRKVRLSSSQHLAHVITTNLCLSVPHLGALHAFQQWTVFQRHNSRTARFIPQGSEQKHIDSLIIWLLPLLNCHCFKIMMFHISIQVSGVSWRIRRSANPGQYFSWRPPQVG